MMIIYALKSDYKPNFILIIKIFVEMFNFFGQGEITLQDV